MPTERLYGFEMSRISEVYFSALSEKLSPLGLDRHFRAFMYLCRHSGKVTQNDLAQELKRDKVFTMRLVDKFCDKGLVTRKTDSCDRRCHLLEVTDKAMNLLPKMESAVRETNDLLLKSLSKEEKEFFETCMDKLYTQLGNMPESDYIVKAVKRNKTKQG